MKQALHNTINLLADDEIVDFNMAELKIDGRQFFKMGQIKRADMPQLKGWPRVGSIACHLEISKSGKVDVSDNFLNWLSLAYKPRIDSGLMSAKFMSGSQNELVASKVAKHVTKMVKDADYKKFNQVYLLSETNDLLDGHHGWAAVKTFDYLYDESHSLKFTRIGLPTEKLIDAARTFAQVVGVMSKEGL